MKYIFQDGGQQNPQESTGFFSNLLDNLITQRQQAQTDNTAVDNTTNTSDVNAESDYIKNLRGYDEQQTSDAQAKQVADNSKRLDQMMNILNQHASNLEEQQSQVDWFGSDDGVNYTRSFYDTQTNTQPLASKEQPLTAQQLQQRQLQAESGGSDTALSPKGAMGAYQFMPSTWNEFKPSPNASPNNRADSQAAYTNYMSHLTTQFGGDQRKAVAAYNDGPGNVNKLTKQYGSDWEAHLPAETKNYLGSIFGQGSTNSQGIQTKNSGVNLANVNKELLHIVGGVSAQFPGVVVTSGDDSTHLPNSAHYDGDAVDIGANSSNKDAYNKFKASLPSLQSKYGVKYIDEGDHIHLSLSSKGKT